ncbi:MAG TPA: glycosyl hydrolase [Acidimicrobiales bacterium]|nr:glycosyl hydrolase [Acidimicrobiales bacterium]
MKGSGIGWLLGLPKGVTVAALSAALATTVGVDLTSAGPAPVAAAAPAPSTTAAPAPSTTAAPAPTTTTAPAPTTTAVPAPAPTTTAVPAHAPARALAPSPPARSAPPARPAPAPAGARSPRAVPFGVYVGAGDPAGVAAFAAATGTHPRYASDYLPTDQGWAGMTQASTLSWLTGAWKGSGYTLVLGVPMIPTDASGTPQGTLAAGAAGQYDASFVTLAQELVAGGEGDAVLRLGWEFNGDWYPWSVTDATDAADYAAYFRAIVTAMRSVPGQAFCFVWNPNDGGSYGDAYTPAQAYPGNAYVDDVGIDVYDQCWSSPQTPAAAWAEASAGTWGLDWAVGFAAAQGKPVAVPEWGLDGGVPQGMGDDPAFVSTFGAWIAANDVAFTSYFDDDVADGSHDLLDGSFPDALAAFRTVFG